MEKKNFCLFIDLKEGLLVDQFYRVNAIPFCAEVNNQGFTKFRNNLASIPDLHESFSSLLNYYLFSVYTNQNNLKVNSLSINWY